MGVKLGLSTQAKIADLRCLRTNNRRNIKEVRENYGMGWSSGMGVGRGANNPTL